MKTYLSILLIMLNFSVVNAQISSKKFNPETNLIEWPKQFNPEKSDFYVYNEIEINTAPDVVWKLLIEASDWSKWYNNIQNIQFENPQQRNLSAQAKVFWKSMGQELNNTVTQFEPNKALAWQFDEPKIQGYHAWLIIPTENGCKVVTVESQTGRLARLQKVFLPNKLRKQHDEWLVKLKEQAENPTKGLSMILQIPNNHLRKTVE
ncbi:SRPBCC domain-containing protein [Belliella sp. DSM 107340]|uniref:SRPBCC domain-containing protein n=1 Tax=Belliella calami TaxID=2923436 RepID=A0ABS9UJF7_9BACT|nr:SRPBCC domain-containing protein [Belliella calami]MCH7396751.1 SRPBCC domain-containing protein [Belliella calami]